MALGVRYYRFSRNEWTETISDQTGPSGHFPEGAILLLTPSLSIA